MLSSHFKNIKNPKRIPNSSFTFEMLQNNEPLLIEEENYTTTKHPITPALISQLYAKKEVEIGIFDKDKDRNFPNERRRMVLEDAIEKFYKNNLPNIKYYLMEHVIDSEFPNLLPYLHHLTFLVENKEMQYRLWFGESGNISPLHFDAMHNLLYQSYGRKDIIIFSPQDTPYLYPNVDMKRFNYTMIDSFTKLNIDRFPLAPLSSPYIVTMNPGDVLYIPSGWWHHATSLDLSITIPCWWKPKISETPLSLIFRLKAWECYDKNIIHKLAQFVELGSFKSSLDIANELISHGYYWLAVLYISNHLKEQNKEEFISHWKELIETARQENDAALSPQTTINYLNFARGAN